MSGILKKICKLAEMGHSSSKSLWSERQWIIPVQSLASVLHFSGSNILESKFGGSTENTLEKKENANSFLLRKSLRRKKLQQIFEFYQLLVLFIQQKVEKTQKSAEAGCLKLLSWLNFFFFSWGFFSSGAQQCSYLFIFNFEMPVEIVSFHFTLF